jgi:hypothetical protein
LSFGIKTSPMSTSYEDVLRVWQEADGITAIDHAWLWDHFLPLFRDPTEPIHEGWTCCLRWRRKRIGYRSASL